MKVCSFLSFLLLPSWGNAEEHHRAAEEGRKLDVVIVPTGTPTVHPTTLSPTENPTPTPTTSQEPSISIAPTSPPTPIASQNPTISSAPTFPPAPECPGVSDEDYFHVADRDYFYDWQLGYQFKVEKTCIYRVSGGERGTTYHQTPQEFLDEAAVRMSGYRVKNDAVSLTGLPPNEGDLAISDCAEGGEPNACVTFAGASPAVTGGDMVFAFTTADYAYNFHSAMDDFVEEGGAAWATYGSKRCGKGPFCWDGTGGKGFGKPYTKCYVDPQVTTGHCGAFDYVIEGDMDTIPVLYERCGDPWLWFQACIASYGCTKLESDGTFNYGRPSRSTYKRDGKWYFRLSGNGMTGRITWDCGEDGQENALGIKDFADNLYSRNIFSANGECAAPTEAPTVMQTISPAPTMPDAPKCTEDGNMAWTKHFTGNQCSTNKKAKIGGQYVKANIDERCFFTIDGKDYELRVGDWIDDALKIWFGASKVANGAVLNGQSPVSGDISYFLNEGNNKWTAKLTGVGVSGGDMIWEFETKNDARYTKDWLNHLITREPLIFQTLQDGSMMCGAGPFCFDDKKLTTCTIDRTYSENCGTFDYVIKGNGAPLRTGDVWEWYMACVESYGCTLSSYYDGQFKYGSVNLSHWWDSKKETWFFRLSGNGVSGKILWTCEDEEAALGMRTITEAIRQEHYFEMDPQVCTDSPSMSPTYITDSPTMSPTECVDSLLSVPPLNIALVIDMSYSTYDTDFDGSEVGDLNNDGKANTILDAEIAAVLELLQVVLDDPNLDNSNTDIGLVVFDTSATFKGRFHPLNSANDGFNEDLVATVTGLSTLIAPVDVADSNTGFTNFDDALDKAIEYFEVPEVDTSRNNVMVFLSDGLPNVRGDGDDEPWCPDVPSGLDCSMAPANIPSDKPWENGGLGFCTGGDTSCRFHEFKDCALGLDSCQDKDPAKMYQSELDKLNTWGVYRLAIGVGEGSDNSMNSALYEIDSNPNKQNGILPYKVLTTDDLSNALRNLCIENTDPPTMTPSDLPSPAPTASPEPSVLPSATPTDGPTSVPSIAPSDSPTGSPVDSPSIGPTDTPTKSPTLTPTVRDTPAPVTPSPTACVYTLLDFTVRGKGIVNPQEWKEFGMRVDSEQDTLMAFYDYGGDIGDAMIVTLPSDLQDPIPKPDGGKVIITLDGTFEDTMSLNFFGLDQPVTVETQLESGGTVETVSVSPSPEEQTVEVTVEGMFRVTITFEGAGAISEIGVCRDPSSTPAPIGLAPPSETNEPTSAPVTYPPISSCPDDVKLLSQIGETPIDDLPITIRSRDKESVTFTVENTWSESLDYMYVQYDGVGHDEPCIKIEQVAKSSTTEFTALCMQHVPVTVVAIWVSDANAVLAGDDAVIPRCCHGPEDDTNPKVQYAFELICFCPETDTA